MNKSLKASLEAELTELLNDALENGDIKTTVEDLKASLAAAWEAALQNVGVK